MSSEGSVTGWLGELQAGEEAAVQKLWERYFDQLVRLARKKLQNAPRRVADEEDVALSAFQSFCRHAENGRFPQLQDRHNLWQLLVVVTARKASHMKRDASRQKRGGGQTAVPLDTLPMKEMMSSEPTPAFAAEVAEEYQRLLGQLKDPELERVAAWKMEGWTSEEIAEKLACAPRTVERKLRLIRSIWEKDET